jgi:hypothetical protein
LYIVDQWLLRSGQLVQVPHTWVQADSVDGTAGLRFDDGVPVVKEGVQGSEAFIF